MKPSEVGGNSPDAGGAVSRFNDAPLDFAHLANQTMGDKDLERELLLMFSSQAGQALEEFVGADADTISASAHRLKGAAAAIGAFQVSSAAERLEADPSNMSLQAQVVTAVIAARDFILDYCR
jgi:HPt (histidine-containing phosphotransfer) domain-containing protein